MIVILIKFIFSLGRYWRWNLIVVFVGFVMRCRLVVCIVNVVGCIILGCSRLIVVIGIRVGIIVFSGFKCDRCCYFEVEWGIMIVIFSLIFRKWIWKFVLINFVYCIVFLLLLIWRVGVLIDIWCCWWVWVFFVVFVFFSVLMMRLYFVGLCYGKFFIFFYYFVKLYCKVLFW